MIKSENTKYREIKTLEDYLDFLAKTNNTIIICLKDTAGYWLDMNIQTKMFKLGLKEMLVNKLFAGYIAIIDNKKIIYEKLGQYNEKVTFRKHINEHLVEVISAPYQNGNLASINIDGMEHAVNDRGINIVVFEKYTNEIIDSVAFDTHVKDFYCTRIKEHYDIGVVGCWWGTNYGSCLNGYAVYKILKSFGLKIWMINRHDLGARRDTPNMKFARKIYEDDEVSPIIPMEQIHKINEKCDIFLAGSDQIWKYWLNRLFDLEFMLKYVDDSKKKISFGTSFGHAWDSTPKDILPETYRLLRRFDAISVRENSGVDICREVYGIKAKRVIEPVFCLSIQEYDKLAEKATIEETEPYMLSYILDPTEEIRNAIMDYSSLLGIKAVNVLDLDYMVYEENKKKLNLENTLQQISPEDLMLLYSKCSFVLTDSFHGTAFAIIFNKPFLSVNNTKRGSVRFFEMLEKFNLIDHLIKDTSTIPVSLDYITDVDYKVINKIIENEREEAVSWLKNMIETPKEHMSNIILPDTISSKLDKEFCTGCSACVNSCPIGAITLEPDECGYYRATVNYEKCIGCETCIKVCPAVQLPQNNNFKEPELYEFIAADENVLYSSSSGGVFPILAKETLKRNGVVVGATWREDFSVEHIIIDSENDLHKLQKSKYLQSYMGDVFQRIKEKLDKSIFVLFSGCPCQNAGLKAFLKNDYENLILVDLLCGNAPSTSFFQKYVRDDFEEPLAAYEFRHKEQGWNWDCTTTTTTTTTGNVIVRRGEKQDSYQRVYHNHVMCPKHCEKCKYQNAPRFGDLTIGDFWGIGEKDKTIDTRKGVSAVLCNNEKGKEFFECISQESVLVKKKVPLAWLGGNGFVNGGCNFASPKRDAFYEAIKTMSFPKAINYALKPNKGIYPEKGLLNYDAKAVHFSFDTSVWEEHYINGVTVLITKQTREKAGKFVTMPLDKMLRKGCSYILKMRFKVKSDSDIINFHVKDSGTRLFQVIYSHKISHSENKWIEINKEFVPDSNIYDEFMIGSGQLYGEGRFLAIDYIDIIENYKG